MEIDNEREEAVGRTKRKRRVGKRVVQRREKQESEEEREREREGGRRTGAAVSYKHV